ncbi:MAG: TadE/TadG family type IV pilus assembly protein [Terriglobales bacterium]
MKLTTDPSRSKERGTQVAEFAVALPLLLFLVLLVTEGAGVIRAHQVLNNIAREGARFASNTTFSGTMTADDTVRDMMAYGWTNNVSFLCNGTLSSPCAVPTETVAAAPAYGLDANSYTYTGSSSMCPSATVVIIQPVWVLTSTGVYIYTSRISVTCNYALHYMPRLLGIPNTVTLSATAEFRNL